MRYYEIMMYEVRRYEPTGVMSPAAADVSFQWHSEALSMGALDMYDIKGLNLCPIA